MEPIEIIPFLVSYKRACSEHLRDIANGEYGYCPIFQFGFSAPKEFKDIPQTDREVAMAWAHKVFKYRYFYDEDMCLLGVFGVPTSIRYLFDGTVYFQNSTDQDYSREDYEGISAFEEIFDKWMDMSDEDLKKAYANARNEPWDDAMAIEFDQEDVNDERTHKRLDYYRRTFCYEEIWEHFQKYLWNDESSIYFSAYGEGERFEMMKFVKFCHDAQLAYDAEYEAKYGETS
jgi:hypothetical protein